MVHVVTKATAWKHDPWYWNFVKEVVFLHIRGILRKLFEFFSFLNGPFPPLKIEISDLATCLLLGWQKVRNQNQPWHFLLDDFSRHWFPINWLMQYNWFLVPTFCKIVLNDIFLEAFLELTWKGFFLVKTIDILKKNQAREWGLQIEVHKLKKGHLKHFSTMVPWNLRHDFLT